MFLPEGSCEVICTYNLAYLHLQNDIETNPDPNTTTDTHPHTHVCSHVYTHRHPQNIEICNCGYLIRSFYETMDTKFQVSIKCITYKSEFSVHVTYKYAIMNTRFEVSIKQLPSGWAEHSIIMSHGTSSSLRTTTRSPTYTHTHIHIRTHHIYTRTHTHIHAHTYFCYIKSSHAAPSSRSTPPLGRPPDTHTHEYNVNVCVRVT